MTFLNGARWLSGLVIGVLNWTPTASRTITLPDDSGILQLDGKPTTVYRSIVAIGGTKTLVLADLGTYQYCTNTAAITMSIPLNSVTSFPVGTEIEIKKGGAGTLAIAVISGVALLGDGGATVTTPFSLNKGATIKKVGVDSWVLEGS